MRPNDLPFWDFAERFFRWWIGELREFLPDQLVPTRRLLDARILIQCGATGLDCYEVRGDSRRSLGCLPGPGADAVERQATLAELAPYLAQSTAVHLSLSDSSVLRRRIQLPAAARRSVREVLAYEMDRQTPFRADQVYYDFSILDDSPGSEVSVELVAVPRVALEKLLDSLESLSIQVDSVNVGAFVEHMADSRDTQINLLPPERRGRRNRLLNQSHVKLAGVVATLLTFALVLPIVKVTYLERRLGQEVAATQARAEPVLEQRERLHSHLQDTISLLHLKRSSPIVIEIVAELARILPDGTWLSALHLQQDTLRIRGHSTASSELISVMEESPAFRRVSFVSPVTQDPKTGNERFEIQAHIWASG